LGLRLFTGKEFHSILSTLAIEEDHPVTWFGSHNV
jgi:hypothetical protein